MHKGGKLDEYVVLTAILSLAKNRQNQKNSYIWVVKTKNAQVTTASPSEFEHLYREVMLPFFDDVGLYGSSNAMVGL